MVNGSQYYRALESISIASALSTTLTIYPYQIRVHQHWRSKLQLPTARKKEWWPAPANSYLSTLWYTLLVGLEPATFQLLVRRATSSATDSPTPSFHTFWRLPTRQSGGQCDVFQRALICVQVAGYYCPVIICGDRDFNIHVDRDNDVHGAHLADMLQLFDYVQHVTGPTHKLDILSTSSSPEQTLTYRTVGCTCWRYGVRPRPRPLHTALSQVHWQGAVDYEQSMA